MIRYYFIPCRLLKLVVYILLMFSYSTLYSLIEDIWMILRLFMDMLFKFVAGDDNIKNPKCIILDQLLDIDA